MTKNKKLVNGVLMNFTKEEQKQWEEEQAKVQDELPNKLKSELISKIKEECSRRITTSYPDHKQKNMLVDVVEIQQKQINDSSYSLTDEEKTIIQEAKSAKSYIANLRIKSNELEESLTNMSVEELKEFDVTNNNNWN